MSSCHILAQLQPDPASEMDIPFTIPLLCKRKFFFHTDKNDIVKKEHSALGCHTINKDAASCFRSYVFPNLQLFCAKLSPLLNSVLLKTLEQKKGICANIHQHRSLL